MESSTIEIQLGPDLDQAIDEWSTGDSNAATTIKSFFSDLKGVLGIADEDISETPIQDFTISEDALIDSSQATRIADSAKQSGQRAKVLYSLPDPKNLTPEQTKIIRTLKTLAKRDDIDFEITPFGESNGSEQP